MTAYAFPFIPNPGLSMVEAGSAHHQGMTLKDWFAGQIIAAMVGSDPANSNQRDENGQLCGMNETKLVNMAFNAYLTAEMLMRVRAADQKAAH
jgi:hypothetical protein